MDMETKKPEATPEQGYRFQFHGTADEFFKIWIVNTALTIATLGIYSAWAKVRTNKYFYQSTEIAGSTLNYIANPVAILKGRLLAITCLVAYALCAEYAPTAAVVIMVLLLIALPWVITRGLAFRAAMTQWRNVRFRFHGTYVKTAVMYGLLFIPVLLTLGLAYPWAAKKQKEYLVTSHSFGGKTFEASYTTGDFFGIYFTLGAIAIGVSLATLAVSTGIAMMISPTNVEGDPIAAMKILGYVLEVLNPLIVGVVYLGYYNASMTNLTYGNASLPGIRIISTMKAGELIKIYFVNAVAIICTLGLLYPWAKIRVAKYKAQTLGILTSVPLDGFVDEAEQHESAFGEEMGEVFDIDVAI